MILAEEGDSQGTDHLVAALADPDVCEAAREILDARLSRDSESNKN